MENRNLPPPEQPSDKEQHKSWDQDEEEKAPDQGFISSLLEHFKKDEEDDEDKEEKGLGRFLGSLVEREKADEDKPDKKDSENKPPEDETGAEEPPEIYYEEDSTSQVPESEIAEPEIAVSHEATQTESEESDKEPEADKTQPSLEVQGQDDPQEIIKDKREIKPISGGQTDEPENHSINHPQEIKAQQVSETIMPPGGTKTEFSAYNPADFPPTMSERVSAPPIDLRESTRPNQRNSLDAEYSRISSVFPALAVDIMARGRDRKERRRAMKEEAKQARRMEKVQEKLDSAEVNKATYYEQNNDKRAAEEVIDRHEAVFTHEKAETLQRGAPNEASELSPKETPELAKLPPERIQKEIEKAAEKGAPIEGLFERSHEVKEQPAQAKAATSMDGNYSSFARNSTRQMGEYEQDVLSSKPKGSLLDRYGLSGSYAKSISVGMITAVVITAIIIVAIVFF